jgi:Skp family chaperone for outer membrane proteins
VKDLAGPDHGPGPPVRRPAATRSVRASVVARTGSAARLGPRIAAQLQSQVGNRAVARLVAQRSADVVGETEVQAPPVSRTEVPVQRLRPGPEADPKFRALTHDIRAKQHRLAAHPPAKAEAARAQGAAQAPPDDKQAQGKAAQAEKMNAAKPGEFDKAGFIAAVNAAIAKKAPQNLSEARDFSSSGKADAVKGEVAGKVGAGKKASVSAIETTTKAAPDTSQVKDKAVTPLVADQPPPTPATPNPAQAVPDKAPPEDTDFSAGPKQVDGAMADAQVTEEQLAASNEPEFTGALQDKKSGEEHSATAPGQLRASEAQTLSTAKAGAAATGTTAMASMSLGRRAAGSAVAAGKQAAKTTDESRRAKVAATLQKVFDTTKTEVEAILTGIDDKVTTAFDTGEKVARDAFTSEHQQKMDDYKDRRYSGLRGKARWIRDKFKGLPAEANQIFTTARQGYVEKMKQVISSVADLIAGELGRAKKRIAQGREELQTEVHRLPKDLQAIGKEAAGEFSEKFDQLTESVDSKGSELVETLASKYTDALGKVDEEIEAEKEKNKGLIAKAIDAVVGVIKTILQLKDMLLGVLAKAAQAVMAIISDPIGFLGNLVSAVGAGLSAFMSRIGEHLQGGLVTWLLGSASSMGIQLPEKFDLRGIIMMVASMIGLTWDSIKARVISRGVPAQAIEAAEGSLPLIAKLRSEGVGAVWEDIKERVGDLKENLFSKITEYLVPTVLTAGITWIISLLNPASAFIKACKMIIDIITFIVTRGAQIIEFVNSVLDAVIAIAAGGAGGVPALIENALVKSIPVLIGALAAILGVGGIADKVKAFFQSLAKPVFKAVDWITDKIVGVGKKAWSKIKSAGKKIKDKLTGRDRAARPGGGTGPIDLGRPVAFSAGKESHRLWFDRSGTHAKLMVASTPAPVEKHLESIRKHLANATPERQAEAAGPLGEVDGLRAQVVPKADALAAAEATRRSGGAVETSTLVSTEGEVIALEKAMVIPLTRLFELAGVGAGDEVVTLPIPTGGEYRCAKRGSVFIPIGRVSVYPTGLVARYPAQRLREINDLLQGGLRDPGRRKQLEAERKVIKDRDQHNDERSQEMWLNLQKAGLGDSVESINAVLRVLLDAGASVSVGQDVSVRGSGGTLHMDPKWKEIGEGRRLLTTVMFTGVTRSADGGG